MHYQGNPSSVIHFCMTWQIRAMLSYSWMRARFTSFAKAIGIVIKVSSTKSALVAEGLGGNTQLIFEFLNEWGEKQRQLEAKEITWEEYEDWKISYDPRVFVDDMFEGN